MSPNIYSGRLDVSQRVRWLRNLIGSWSMVGYGSDGRMIVTPLAGVQRPPA